MTVATIAIPEDLWLQLSRAVDQDTESAAVVVARWVELSNDRVVVLVREISWLPEELYTRREATGLAIPSAAYVPFLRAASEDGSMALFLHTHPGGIPRPSIHDTTVDQVLASTFATRTHSGAYGSIVVGHRSTNPSLSGLIHLPNGKNGRIERVRIVGRRFTVLPGWGTDSPLPNIPSSEHGVFDRQLRTFGAAGQAIVAGIKVGVVGVGGTGSAVAEQLVRLGVRDVTLVDDDLLASSNLSRVYGSRTVDSGMPKVEVVRRHLLDIGFGTHVTAIQGRVTSKQVAHHLIDRDVIFGCTDDHAGRAVLSRMAYWLLIPVLDMGVSIVTAKGRVEGIYGRVTQVSPSAPCLICRNRIDLDRAREELLPIAERDRLAAEGYVQGLDEPNPSVVSYTSTVASLAVDQFLDRLFGYGTAKLHTELLVILHEWQLRTNDAFGTPGHYCVDRSFWGRGAEEPFLGQLWLD